MPEKEPEPPYYEAVRLAAGNPGLDALDIERSILRSWKAEWSKDPSSCPYNHEETIRFDPALPDRVVRGFTQHMLRYQRYNFPAVQIDPWLVEKWEQFERIRLVEGRKIINFIGSKNSAKTNFFALFSLLMVSIDPSYTRTFISGPYKTAAEATVWGRVGTRYNQMKHAQPTLWKNTQYKKSDQQVVFDHQSSEAGYIELVTLDKVGKLQGAKSLDPYRGWLILMCDEIAEFPSKALMDALDNMTGNLNFVCFTGCNFKNVEGLDGDLCRPEGREYAELDTEKDHDWPSNYRSWTVRFDGHRSPNVIAKKVIYNYLLTEPVRADMEYIHGLTGPKYLEQIRSFPNSSMSDYFVTTREKIRASGGYDEFIWDREGDVTKVAFCDPGFGGDPCKIGAFRFGRGRFQDVDGQWHGMTVFEPISAIETIRLDMKLESDASWRERVTKIAPRDLFMKHDALVSLEQQIAVGCAEFLTRHGIERNNFGYDGSMRASVVHEMTAILGSAIQSIDFGGEATEREVGPKAEPARSLYYNFVTEMYFFFGLVVQSGQFRGAERVPAALAQICRRCWGWSGKKRQIQPKAEYKSENQGRSPDDSDVLVGALEVARRAGFMDNPKRRAASSFGSPIALLKELATMGGIFARSTAKNLNR